MLALLYRLESASQLPAPPLPIEARNRADDRHKLEAGRLSVTDTGKPATLLLMQVERVHCRSRTPPQRRSVAAMLAMDQQRTQRRAQNGKPVALLRAWGPQRLPATGGREQPRG
jgi:hypothetical protein